MPQKKIKNIHSNFFQYCIPSFLYVLRIILALIVSILLFVALPFIYSLFGTNLLPSRSEHTISTALIHVEKKKQAKKEIKKIKPRRIKSQHNQNRSRLFQMKFSPDLNISSGEGIGLKEANFENVIFEEGQADVSARAIVKIPLPYPRRAKEAGIEGLVEMILLIDRKGTVATIDFIRVPHVMFKQPIMKVVKQWKFKPAMNKGIPVKMRVKQRVDFKLEE